MKGECVTTYKRQIWYVISCDRWLDIPTKTLGIKYYGTYDDAKKHSINSQITVSKVGSLTISADSDIHIMEVDE